MSPRSSTAVWSPWQLHADALVTILREAGERTDLVGGPDDASGILVAATDAPDLVAVLRRRSALGRETIVWGGTLSAPQIAALREAGASAYVSALALPRELADVVHRVRDGGDVAWPPEPGSRMTLTGREAGVARAYLVTQADRPRAEVAQGLGVSERTLKVHIARIRDKVGHEGTSTREGLHHELVMRRWL